MSTLSDQEVFERFRQCAVEVLQVEPELITHDTRFVEDLEADSLDLLELALVVEEVFDVRVVETELRGIETVGEAYSLVCTRL